MFLSSLSSIFLQTYMKWESGSSKTKSAGSNPFSVIGIGSKYDFVDEQPPGLLKSGLAADETKSVLRHAKTKVPSSLWPMDLLVKVQKLHNLLNFLYASN